MTKERKLSERDLMNAANRSYAVLAIRGAESGIEHLAKRESWSNAQKVGAYERLAHMVRTTFKPSAKTGERAVLTEGGDLIATTVRAVLAKDEAAEAKKAAKAEAQAKAALPTSAEIAAAAQDGDDSNPEAIAAARALETQVFAQ